MTSWLRCGLLGLALLGLSAQAAELASRDSTYIVTGKKNPADRSIWVQVTKAEAGSLSEDTVFEPSSEDYAEKVFLRHGPGIYHIQVWASDRPATNGTQFYGVSSFQVENQDTRDPFLLPSKYVESDDPRIITLAKLIVRQKKGLLEKSRAIHDWVASHVAYDTKSYFAGNLLEKSALETLRAGRALCSGYANLNAALHRAAGIPAKVMFGIARSMRGLSNSDRSRRPASLNHAWNEVKVGQNSVIQDATWDAGGTLVGTKRFIFQLRHTYFNPSPERFAKDHMVIHVSGR